MRGRWRSLTALCVWIAVNVLGRWRSLTALCVWVMCGYARQMEISHCIVCVDQVWVCWADGDLLCVWISVSVLGRWKSLTALVQIRCGYAGQMETSHCPVCMDQCQCFGQMKISHCFVGVDQV